LEQHARITTSADQTKGKFQLSWAAEKGDDPAVSAIVNTARLAIQTISADYPDHVSCVIKAVKE